MTRADLDYAQPYGVTRVRDADARPASTRQIEAAKAAAEKAGRRVDASLAELRAVTHRDGGSGPSAS
jgi:hypothetical protein